VHVRVMCWAMVLVMASALAWGAGATASAGAEGKAAGPAVQQAKLKVNGTVSEVPVRVVEGTPMVAVRAAMTAMDAKATVAVAATGPEIMLRRPQAIVRFAAGAKQMVVDGQTVALATPAIVRQGSTFVPGAVLQAAFPELDVALTYDAASGTAFLTYKAKPPKVKPAAVVLGSGPAPPPAVTPAANAGAACAAGSGDKGVPTQEFGKAGAKVEILALLPITHGCHVRTEAELKKAYQAHPNDIHLTIVDLFGPEASKYLPKVGGWGRAVVSINGKTTFQYNGRTVSIEKPEGGTYQVTDIGPIIEGEIAAKK